MNKQLTFTYDGKDYTLEYTRRTVQQMEQRGFALEQIQTQPMTALPQLFEGAFLANHRFVKKDLIEEIYSHLGNKKELVARLGEMYADPINALLDDPEDSKGNVDWATSF